MQTGLTPQLSGEWVAGALFAVLTAVMEYWPAFAAWWDRVQVKELVLAGAAMVFCWALVGLHYLGAFGLEIGPFGWDVVGEVIGVWIAILGGDWMLWSLVNRASGGVPRKRGRLEA